jgi:DNA-binding NarL/FixJ family response regulator
MGESARIRVLIADDHPLVRLWLGTMLRTQPDIELVGQAADGDEAVRQALRTRPEVIMLDLRMPRTDGLAALVEIKRALSDADQL